MGRKRIHPPKTPASPAHISEVRRAAALASAKVRAAKAKKRRPKSICIDPDVCDRLEDYAKTKNKTMKDSASELIDYGLTHI